MNKQKLIILKTISYRIIGSSATALIIYLATGNISISLGAGGIELLVKPAIYYVHELAWYRAIIKTKTAVK